MRKNAYGNFQRSIDFDRFSASRQYALTIPRPFSLHYNPYTQAIEVIDGKEKIVNMVRTLRSKRCETIFPFGLLGVRVCLDDMDMVLDALRKSELNGLKVN